MKVPDKARRIPVVLLENNPSGFQPIIQFKPIGPDRVRRQEYMRSIRRQQHAYRPTL